MNNADKPAAPSPYVSSDGTVQYDVYTGLTKREYFAAMAMQGLLSNPNGAMTEGSSTTYSPNGIARIAILHARIAILHADELLKQLEQKP